MNKSGERCIVGCVRTAQVRTSTLSALSTTRYDASTLTCWRRRGRAAAVRRRRRRATVSSSTGRTTTTPTRSSHCAPWRDSTTTARWRSSAPRTRVPLRHDSPPHGTSPWSPTWVSQSLYLVISSVPFGNLTSSARSYIRRPSRARLMHEVKVKGHSVRKFEWKRADGGDYVTSRSNAVDN